MRLQELFEPYAMNPVLPFNWAEADLDGLAKEFGMKRRFSPAFTALLKKRVASISPDMNSLWTQQRLSQGLVCFREVRRLREVWLK